VRRPIEVRGSEDELHCQVCQYLNLQYPDVLYRTDFSSGKLSVRQAVHNKKTQKCRAWPDLFLAEPVGESHGLYLEIKREGEKLFLKDGTTRVKKEHLEEQWEVLEKLKGLGYEASFGVGFDECKTIIDKYLSRRGSHA
jgi:hypothetical protein